VHPSKIVQMWRNHHSKISVAASVAIFGVLSAMFFGGYFANKSQPHYQELRDQIRSVKIANDNKINALATEIRKRRVLSPSNYKGTGFAVSSSGYIVTNYHVIGNKYDSLYVQNSAGESFHAIKVYADPTYDVAILKIDDASFNGLPSLPYNFKKMRSDLGEDVFTLGYSEGDAPVMDKGYVSSTCFYPG
jgi:serine protease Do